MKLNLDLSLVISGLLTISGMIITIIIQSHKEIKKEKLKYIFENKYKAYNLLIEFVSLLESLYLHDYLDYKMIKSDLKNVLSNLFYYNIDIRKKIIAINEYFNLREFYDSPDGSYDSDDSGMHDDIKFLKSQIDKLVIEEKIKI